MKKCGEIFQLMDRRKLLLKKQYLTKDEEEEIDQLKVAVAEKCEEINRKKVKENFEDL